MNDNLLIAAVLREVATAIDRTIRKAGLLPIDVPRALSHVLYERAAELDPPEKNEKAFVWTVATNPSGGHDVMIGDGDSMGLVCNFRLECHAEEYVNWKNEADG